MKKNILISLFFLLIAFNLWVILSGNTFFYTVIYHNLADIDDYKIFPQRKIAKSLHPQAWPLAGGLSGNKISDSLRKELEGLGTVALLVIKKDSIRYEEYWDGYNKNSFSNSFSMAKSYVGAMIGTALKEGKIKNINQKVGDFLPSFRKGRKAEITIKHLLTMSSGLNWKEEYLNPMSTVSEAYYGKELHKLMDALEVTEDPGKIYRYKGGDTQVLAFIIEKVSGKSLSSYAEEKLWQPLGSENPAIWSLDHEGGEEKASCCLNSNARDFARLGQLYLQQGNWNGVQIIDTNYIKASLEPNGLLTPKNENEKVDFYGYQWWVIPDYKGIKVFYARGVSGQYIAVVPSFKMIIVRLGKQRGTRIGMHFKELLDMIDEGIKMK